MGEKKAFRPKMTFATCDKFVVRICGSQKKRNNQRWEKVLRGRDGLAICVTTNPMEKIFEGLLIPKSFMTIGKILC